MTLPTRAAAGLAALLAAVLAVAALVAVSAPAQAATIRIDDPDRDGTQGPRLDITSVRVANNERALVVDVSMRRVVTGDLAIWVKPQGASKREIFIIASQHRADGDRNRIISSDDRRPCRALTTDWNARRDVVRVRLPSRCLRGGDYSALRVRLITERRGGDVDIAPQTARGDWPWSRLVARG
ncbi:hypothetical protein GCM10023340_27720 [Nocardioides marinquilinus]|uniref:Uncharacterized protein n=1 Tax=Nocardioides marinquilinus TaxID=1210400 RepID=A0ABP9PUK6_9ACTN